MSSRSDPLPAARGGAPAAPPAAPSPAFPELPVTRHPDSALLTYYALTSLLIGPLFPFILIPLYFKYHSLRYIVEEEGITMRWGVLFRREISLTYSRIQDIHLSSNVIERWLGLAKIQVQTASGSASAEMTIEGLREFEGVRDFLYARMRGAKDRPASAVAHPGGATDASLGALASTLSEIAAEVRELRHALQPAAREEPGDA